jgi:hypothetical protein
MPTTKLLTLSGALQHPVQISDYLLASYFKTLRSQSYLYSRSGAVYSLMGDLADCQNDARRLEELVNGSITGLFRPYFENVSTEINVVEDTQMPNHLELRMAISVTDGGVAYNVTYQLMTTNSTVKSIAKLNNEGLYV